MVIPAAEHLAVDLDESWLPDMHVWLNDPFVSRMARVDQVSEESQQEWFDRIRGREDYWIQGIQSPDGERLGAVGMRNITKYAGEGFNYFGPAAARGRGLGQWSLRMMEVEAVRRGLTRIWGIVALDNPASQGQAKRAGWSAAAPYQDWGLIVDKQVRRFDPPFELP